MWPALVLACISSLSLSASRVASEDPGSLVLHSTQANLVTERAPGETIKSTFNQTSGRMTTPSPVPPAKGTSGASHRPPTAGRTHRTDVVASATAAGAPDPTASRVPTLPSPTSTRPTTSSTVPTLPSPTSTRPTAPSTVPTLPSPTSTRPTAPSTVPTLPSPTSTRPTAPSTVPTLPSPTSTQPTPSSSAALNKPHAQAPSSSESPRAAPLTSLATSTQAAATTAGTSSAAGMQSPAEHTPGPSTSSPVSPRIPQALNTLTPGPTTQPSTAQRVADTASRPTSPLVNTTPGSTLSSVASTSTTAAKATKAQAERPAASTVPAPVPHASPTPRVEATSPMTTPSPVSSPRGATGPGTPPTPEQVQPETTGGTASTGPTPGSSGDPKLPTTDSCQLSTEGQYLVITTKPLPLSSVNRSALLAVLLLGVALFFAVLVLFALQAYESYKKKDYTQVDYLINGMYADSEM